MMDKDKIVKEINDEEWRKVLNFISTDVRPSGYNFDNIYLSEEGINEILKWNTS